MLQAVAKLSGRLGVPCRVARAVGVGVMLIGPVTAYANDGLNVPNVIEDLFHGSDHSHRAYQERVDSAWRDPFKPRTIDGLSSNPNACASYGCVDVGGD
jgi:hypothetical protein